MTTTNLRRLSAVLAVICACLGILLLVGTCYGDSLERQWTKRTKLLAAQCLVAEAGWSGDYTELQTERAAILHVLVKRWVQLQGYRKTPLAQMISRYCSVHRVRSVPQAWVRVLRWEKPVPVRVCPARNCDGPWIDVQDLVERFSRGEVEDPLPTAMHWGNADDHRKRYKAGRIGRVRAQRLWPQGFNPQNIFYAVLR